MNYAKQMINIFREANKIQSQVFDNLIELSRRRQVKNTKNVLINSNRQPVSNIEHANMTYHHEPNHETTKMATKITNDSFTTEKQRENDNMSIDSQDTNDYDHPTTTLTNTEKEPIHKKCTSPPLPLNKIFQPSLFNINNLSSLEPCTEEAESVSDSSMPSLIPTKNYSSDDSTYHEESNEYTANIFDLNDESILIENKIISITLRKQNYLHYFTSKWNF